MGKKEGTKVEYILATRNELIDSIILSRAFCTSTTLKKYHLATIAFWTGNKLGSHLCYLRGSIAK